MTYLDNLMQLFLEAAPWLLLGLLAAGLLKAWVPEKKLVGWVGGVGIWPITKAAFIGAPLPLCSCGVLPAALGLHRCGASRGATVAFMIATPETGPDSISISYALLGPFMAAVRPLAAVVSAIFSGLLVRLVPEPALKPRQHPVVRTATDCCGDADSCCNPTSEPMQPGVSRTLRGLRYALTEILDDIVIWLLVGLLLAAAVMTWVPPLTMAEWGSGLPAMLMMLLVGIPMYICATASTPIAAALLLAGVSPGTVLVFLLAGPATNIATMAVIQREMGSTTLVTYLTGICLGSLAFGLLTDLIINRLDIDIVAQIAETSDWMPASVTYISCLVLLVFGVKPVRKLILR